MLKRRALLKGSIGTALASGMRAYGKSPANAEVDNVFAAEVASHSETAGIVAVLVDETGSHFVVRGHSGDTDNPSLTGGTVFEIGSITKVITALILMDMSIRGEVAMTDR